MEFRTLELSAYLCLWLTISARSLHSLWIYSHKEGNKSFLWKIAALNKGWLAPSKDARNTQWSIVCFWIFLQPNFCLCLFAYMTKLWTSFELLLSVFTLSSIISPVLILITTGLTLTYSVCGYVFRSKFLIWSMFLTMFIILDSYMNEIYWTIYNEASTDVVAYVQISTLQSSLALILIRSVSLGLEHANTPGCCPSSIIVEKLTVSGVLEALCYILYPPNFLFGPIVSFADWCFWRKFQLNLPFPNSLHVQLDFRGCLTKRKLSFLRLFWRAFRLLFWFLVWESAIHLVYPSGLVTALTQPSAGSFPPPPRAWVRNLTDDEPFHSSPHIKIDRSALGMSVYLIGLQFFFTYMQFYGWPAVISDTQLLLASRRSRLHGDKDNGERASSEFFCLIPDGPTCPTHVFLFSDMWRSFDRGLYNFLKWYIYLPCLKCLPGSSVVQRFQGGILCFAFVLTFHSWNEQNCIWVAINMMQIFLERFVQWAFFDTEFGLLVKNMLSASSLRRITGILCSISAMTSSVGFFFFYLGSESGVWIAYWMFLDRVYPLVAVLIYYCTYQLSVEAKRLCSYKKRSTYSAYGK